MKKIISIHLWCKQGCKHSCSTQPELLKLSVSTVCSGFVLIYAAIGCNFILGLVLDMLLAAPILHADLKFLTLLLHLKNDCTTSSLILSSLVHRRFNGGGALLHTCRYLHFDEKRISSRMRDLRGIHGVNRIHCHVYQHIMFLISCVGLHHTAIEI